MFRPTPFTNDGDPTVITELDDPIGFFRQHDFSCLRGVIDPSLCAAAVADAVTVQRTAMDARSNPDGVWRLDEASPSLRAIFASESLRDAVVAAHGTADVHFACWVVFERPAGASGTMWHRDAEFVPFQGDVVQFWLPLLPLPGGIGLKFVDAATGADAPIAFGNLQPGDMTCHRQTVVHAGQTYDADTCGLSFITFGAGAVLEDSDAPLPHQKRMGMMTRLFPDQAFGEVAGGAGTPLLVDIAR